MRAKRIITVILCLFTALPFCNAQDSDLYKKVVKDLSSSRFQGRGYAKNGVIKAGKYIEKQFMKAGADEVVLQPFTIDINTFPGKAEMSIDGKKLIPGDDFVMREYSPGIEGEFKLYFIDTLNYNSEKIFLDLAKPENKDALVVCDFWFTYKHSGDFRKLQSAEGAPNAGLIFTWDTPMKFYKAYGEKVVDKPVIWVMSELMDGAKKIQINVENKFLPHYETSNVIARVNGERHDSCYVFTAHYDHLGNFGRRLYFPGANDNASGVAAIITLAEYYAQHKPEFDMVFVAFSGEEANLRGSNFYAEHPSVALESIKYLFNIDMIGDNNPVQYCEVSEPGMSLFENMKAINAREHYFRELNLGELAANSDHWPFAQRGVPCILFENESGDTFPYYHTAKDNWDIAVFTTYEPIFNLITKSIIED